MIGDAVEELSETVRRALAEDIGPGDVTGEAVVEPGERAVGTFVQKEPGVLCGYGAARECFAQVDPGFAWEDLAREAEWRDEVPAEVARVTGSARALLAAERVALNFLARLSGIATLTARCVAAVEGTGVRVLDTRKTTPGLRALEKQAVKAGGGENHRMGLYDAILIKGNHVDLAGGIGEAVRRARARRGDLPVEVECRDLTEAEEAAAAGARRLLLDNMTPAELREAADRLGERVELEASGGITLETVGEIAAAHVHFVSIGALTHSAPALDISLRIKPL